MALLSLARAHDDQNVSHSYEKNTYLFLPSIICFLFT